MKVVLHGYATIDDVLNSKPKRSRLVEGSMEDLDLGIKEFGTEMERDFPNSFVELNSLEA